MKFYSILFLIALPLLLRAQQNYQSSPWHLAGNDFASLDMAEDPDIAVSPQGNPWVVFSDFVTRERTSVRWLNGTQWEYAGAPGFSDSTTKFNIIRFNAAGVPYVLYIDQKYNRGAVLKKFNGTEWETVGNPGFTGQYTYWMSLAFDAGRVPYVSYTDGMMHNRVSVMRFVGEHWEYVGNPGISPGGAYWTSLAFDKDGMLCMAYVDSLNHYTARVLKYEGGNWLPLGDHPPSPSAWCTRLVVSPDDSIYIAFQDEENANKATVKKFTGTLWETVGKPGFSSWTTNFLNFKFSPYGEPFTCYSAMENQFLVPVNRFSNGSWQEVGGSAIPGFSTIGITCLDFDPEGRIYVCFRNDSNSGRAAVLTMDEKFNAVPEDRTSAFEFYPNPATDFITLSRPGNTYKTWLATLCSPDGRILKSISGTDNEMKMDVQESSTGLYILTVNDGVQRLSEILVKK